MRVSAEPLAKRRIDFLDFIRGIAALSVVVEHVAEINFPPAKIFLLHSFNFGVFGVIAFFILSGFVIPFTIEKYNDLRLFWTNRFFRLYPLYWASLIVATLIMVSGLHPGTPPFESNLPISFLANLTMFQELAKQPHAIGLYWTLGFELIFYLIMSLLFVCKMNQKSAWVLGVGILAIAYSGIWRSLQTGQSHFPYVIFWMTCFFFGTATYRFWVGDMTKKLYLVLTSVFFGTVAVSAFINFYHFEMRIVSKVPVYATASVTAWAAAMAFFLIITFGPKFRIPIFFQWLGRISYSVYIVHGVLILLPLTFVPIVNAAVVLVGTLMVSWASHTWIEAPCQELGKKVIAKMKARRLALTTP